MTWAEKIVCYTQEFDVKYATIERAAGWSVNSLSARLGTGAKVNVEDALRLARALGLQMEWLYDTATDWPPPMSDRELMEAVGRLHHLAAEVRRREKETGDA